jgi:hypothetical protein
MTRSSAVGCTAMLVLIGRKRISRMGLRIGVHPSDIDYPFISDKVSMSMSGKVRKVVRVSAGILLAAILALLVFIFSPPAPRSLPNPNGYDDFVKAGNAVIGEASDFSDLGKAALRDLVATNSEALRLFSLGLTRRCAVPTEAAITNFSSESKHLLSLKRLARLLAAEGRLYELEGRPGEAARYYALDIRLGNEISHGLPIYRLVGIAIEALGETRLATIAGELKPSEAHTVIEDLEKIEATRVRWEELLENENRWLRYNMAKTANPLAWITGWWQAHKMRSALKQRHDEALARTRLLLVELALSAYRAEKGSEPLTLDDLAPKYLQQVPLDPFSGREPVYRVRRTNWLLYSVGPDGADNGGSAYDRSHGTGDISIDSRW